MKTIAIIGAGNMGGAIARGIAGHLQNIKLVVSNLETEPLEKLKADFPTIDVTVNNAVAIKQADAVIFAVKPKVLPLVAKEIGNLELPDTIISIVAGVDTHSLQDMFGKKAVFRIIPNTAITVGKGMTFISSKDADDEKTHLVAEIFSAMGEIAIIPESMMSAATALSSCGIAYVYKYIQASVQAGVQLGFTPFDALKYTLATVEGAAAMLHNANTTPQKEIDRVTTPGGMTIKGINNLEHTGFTASVIDAIIAPLEK